MSNNYFYREIYIFGFYLLEDILKLKPGRVNNDNKNEEDINSHMFMYSIEDNHPAMMLHNFHLKVVTVTGSLSVKYLNFYLT